MGIGGGILGLLILIGDVVAILNVFGSTEPLSSKAFWIVIILVLPLLGLILWYFMGPRSATP